MNETKEPFVVRVKSVNPQNHKINLLLSRDEIAEIARTRLLDFLQLIVDSPNEVSAQVSFGERTIIFKVDCSKRNFSKILGSKGKMISSLRHMTLAITARHGYRSIVEIPYYTPDANND